VNTVCHAAAASQREGQNVKPLPSFTRGVAAARFVPKSLPGCLKEGKEKGTCRCRVRAEARSLVLQRQTAGMLATAPNVQ